MTSMICFFILAAQLLFDTGVKDVDSGKLERARLTLQTLVNTYPNDPLAAGAKDELNAIELFEEGQDRMRQGRYDAAEFTFETLLSVYPKSQLVPRAEAAMHAATQARALSVNLTVRAVDLKGAGVPAVQAEKRFAEREVKLAAGKPFDPRDVDQARMALIELLSETGSAGAQIRTEARMAGAHEVDIVFTRVR
jgi:tetratricopeptide (TPR) repeat protein